MPQHLDDQVVTFMLRIESGNDAVVQAPGYEIARILRDVATRVETSDTGVSAVVQDVNGNRVGFWKMDLF